MFVPCYDLIMLTALAPLRWFWEGWKRAGHAIGIVLSFVVLTMLWIVAFGLYALIMKCGRVFKDTAPATYWRAVDPDYPESLLHGF